MGVGHAEHRQRGVEGSVAVRGDDDRGGLVGPEDRHLLGHVIGGRSDQTGGAHQDHRFGGQVDVLLVLGGVARDRLVAELRQLDPQLAGRDLVGAVADDRPVAARRGEGPGRGRDVGAGGEGGLERGGHLGEGAQQLLLVGVIGGAAAGHLLGDGVAEQQSGRDLRVERLGRRHAHLHVASVGGVEDAVGLVGQVRVASVDDRHHRRSPPPKQVDGAVGVGGGARLADRDGQRVGHVGAEAEPRQLRRR